MSSNASFKPSRPGLTAHSSLSSHLQPPIPSRTPSGYNSHAQSRRHSRSSTPIPPHEQQHTFVPTFDDIGITSTALNERALFDSTDGENLDDRAGSNKRSTPASLDDRSYGAVAHDDVANHEDADESDEDEDDDTPNWRKASPTWIYPFIVGIPLCLGMSMAPKSELYINLACLVHPPSASQDSTHSTAASTFGLDLNTERRGVAFESGSNFNYQTYHAGSIGIGMDSAVGPVAVKDRLNSNDNVTIGLPDDDELSPADKWFLKLQHDIYEYERTHPRRSSSSPSPSSPSQGGGSGRTPRSTIRPPTAEPTSPLPKPDEPFPGEKGDDNGRGERKPKHDKHGGAEEEQNDGPYKEIDPRLCKKDVKVQATAARLTMFMTTTMGVLAALTTGFWGKTSDKFGRTKVMAVVELGLFLNEICFITVATFPYLVPGGYNALLLAPTLEGLAGGYATITATVYAYVSDITPDGSRVTMFARMSGIFMAGFALGPVVGSMLITATGNIMTPFYINACIYAFYIPLVLFLLPESLSPKARARLAKKAALKKEEAARKDVAEREWEDETPALPNQSSYQEENDPLLSGWSRVSVSMSGPGASKTSKRTFGRLKRLTRRMFAFLEPLTVFIPSEKEVGRGRNWNLTMLGVTIFCSSVVFGVMPIKAQYTFFAYGWTSKQLGPFMSTTAFARSFVLIVLVPTVMRFVKPRFLCAEAASQASSAVNAQTAERQAPDSSKSPLGTQPAAGTAQPQRSAHLDLITARLCLFVETIPYILLSLSPSAPEFVIYTVLTTFGAPSGPAANSLALSLLTDPSQSGRLFGALAVVQAMGSSLLGPLLYGTLYAKTVGTWAGAVFALTTAILVLGQTALCFVRLDQRKADVEEAPQHTVAPVNGNSGNGASTGLGVNLEEEGTDEEGERQRKRKRDARGRSRRVKRVSGSGSSQSGASTPSVQGSSGVSRMSTNA